MITPTNWLNVVFGTDRATIIRELSGGGFFTQTVWPILDESLQTLKDDGSFMGDFLDKNLIQFCFLHADDAGEEYTLHVELFCNPGLTLPQRMAVS